MERLVRHAYLLRILNLNNKNRYAEDRFPLEYVPTVFENFTT